jgi:Zn-dependent protease
MIDRLLMAPAFLIALTIHELAHALVADRLGDPTPRVNSRISLNPLKHLDPFGALLFLVTGFGWAKPVVYDPYNLAHPRRDGSLIALAGPASNLLFALLLSLFVRLFPALPFLEFLIPFIFINVSLAIFNLVPVSPLDGEKILAGLLPRDLAYEFQAVMSRYGTIILIVLLLPVFSRTSPIQSLIQPIISSISYFLLP